MLLAYGEHLAEFTVDHGHGIGYQVHVSDSDTSQRVCIWIPEGCDLPGDRVSGASDLQGIASYVCYLHHGAVAQADVDVVW